MNGDVQPRRPNGKRLEGRGLATMVAKEVHGMLLSQAYVEIRSAGMGARVAAIDGERRSALDNQQAALWIDLDVRDGVVVSAKVR